MKPGYLDHRDYKNPGPATVKASQFELDKMLAGGHYVVEVDKSGRLKVIGRFASLGEYCERFAEDEDLRQPDANLSKGFSEVG